ncbi:ankyrin repeat domain-containing protein [Candidatus Mesenet endosymbiont of Agriotes lineatus]|uniref:ankyrin repeat domain-containing protein n=1 Tax=Candidatus Mesenet endosymbiont of Agriotes lineatus TaxID=3077948 RepID=UPI0030CAE999
MLGLDGGAELLQASRNGEIEKVQSLLNQGENVNATDTYGDSDIPLHYAAAKGHTNVITLLLQHKADVHAQNKCGQTPLHCAAEKGHTNVITLLLQHKADVHAQDYCGQTPLYWAAEKGHEEVVKLLIEKGADVHAQDYYGEIPLHYAAEEGHIEVAQLLIEKGAGVHTQDNYGRTPLHWAAKGGHIEVAQLLLKNGADVNTKSKNGNTSLHLAAEYGYVKILFLLLLYGADISAEDRWEINRKPKLTSCLAEFKQIKGMPHFGRLIKAHKDGNIKEAILPLINNKEALIKDLQEIKERCSSNEQLSFIPKYLYDFEKHIASKTKQAYKIKECKTEAVSSLMNIGYKNIKLSPKLSTIRKILLWIKQCFYKIMPFLTKNIDDALPEKQCHNNNFHDAAGNIAQYLSAKDLQNLALVCKDINISVNNEKECSEKRINRSMDRLMTDIRQVLDESTTIGIYGSFIKR